MLVHVDPVLARVVSLLRSICDHARSPNPLDAVKEAEDLLRDEGNLLGSDPVLDSALRQLPDRLHELAPEDPEPHAEYPFVDSWKNVRREVSGALALLFE